MARPSVYKDTYPDELVKLMDEGKLDFEVFAEWDICKDTFYRWLNEYPDLKEAYDRGYAKCYRWWMTKGREKFAASDDKGFKYWIAVMNNKFWLLPDSKNTTNINIQNMNILELKQKTSEQLKQFIQDKLLLYQPQQTPEPIKCLEAPIENDPDSG